MGWSCHIPYPWVAGHRYRLRVETDEPGWWAASVADDDSGVVSPIGRIRVPPTTGLGYWSVMWTEYYGPSVHQCSDLATARALFGTPTAPGRTVPERRHSHLGELAGPALDHTTCDTSSIEDLPDGVRHQMGGAPG